MLTVILKCDRPDREPFTGVIHGTDGLEKPSNEALQFHLFASVGEARKELTTYKNPGRWNLICDAVTVAWGETNSVGIDVSDIMMSQLGIIPYLETYKQDICGTLRAFADSTARCPACGKLEYAVEG